ncbi:MAG: hypothetical protein IPO08_15395 [Xanthomonadales bacterium]|nr:hypothetical protein [Xanthomonadales bacterium]
MTKNKQVYETPLVIGLDRRADYNEADRAAQFEAAMRVHGLFGRMTDLTDRIQYSRMMAGAIAAQLPEKDRLRAQLSAFADAAETVRAGHRRHQGRRCHHGRGASA